VVAILYASFFSGCSNIICIIFADKGSQYDHYATTLMNSPGIIHVARLKIIDAYFHDAATSVSLTFFAKMMSNSLSLATRDYAACMITESVILKIVDALLRLTLNTS